MSNNDNHALIIQLRIAPDDEQLKKALEAFRSALPHYSWGNVRKLKSFEDVHIVDLNKLFMNHRDIGTDW